ncbi:f-box domain containing protein [Grosmannia clavigera kw1407]|uniref:F-box domain containing protein n=1 Tax=Grosmannia clavigera (strain kw1407 / UAMH 11150) TaxID=655863 RepID=F0XDW1_GROCL|nr:f-box domain containing protein [Grosmannia clavigera kw1407]EFX04809.1 f-box domain containing protein [Grosmannia clavigera kw1407]
MFEGLYRSSGGSASLLAREKSAVAAGIRPPRRALSTNDFIYPTPPSRTLLIQTSGLSTCSPADVTPQRPPTIAEETATAILSPRRRRLLPAQALNRESSPARPQRPKLGAPRRSYSVMDYEPVPPTHQPSANLQLADLPAELHYAIFDFLDPIDSTCLGLTNKHFYAIHRRMHGTVPLSARRTGPNDMEWVWHKAGRLSPPPTPPASPPGLDKILVGMDAATQGTGTPITTPTSPKALALLRVRGQALCRKCGVSRCELHTHIQTWMGPGYEYCAVRDKFGKPALEGARESCFRSSPKHPNRCGRHHVPKTQPMSP